MSLEKLAAELLAGHPDTGPYSANAETAANEINAVNRSRNIDSLSGDVVFQTTDATEFAGLTDSAKALWLSFCGRDQIDPFRSANVAFVRAIFGNQSATVQALSAFRTEAISRAQEIGFGRPVQADQIRHVRGEL
jgi:hypothetical protein